VGVLTDLLDRPVYGFVQVDSLLALPPGTARRWIDGYARNGHYYDPVVREHTTEERTVTWGEFVETRLLAEYRDAGVPIVHMRPVVVLLREWLGVRYPLAHARPSRHPSQDGTPGLPSTQGGDAPTP
jgi:hypothetical protein